MVDKEYQAYEVLVELFIYMLGIFGLVGFASLWDDLPILVGVLLFIFVSFVSVKGLIEIYKK